MNEWKKAQEGEYQYHLMDYWRNTNAFLMDTFELFDSFGYHNNDYVDKTIIDLGAGSRLRTRYFIGSEIIAIEPLAGRFITTIPWCDLHLANPIFAKPAEEFIPELEDSADLIVSINVLDHCYDFRKIIQNIAKYMKLGDKSRALLSFDCHKDTNDMHPLSLNEQMCERAFNDAGLEYVWYDKRVETYGHGEYALTYLLRRAA